MRIMYGDSLDVNRSMCYGTCMKIYDMIPVNELEQITLWAKVRQLKEADWQSTTVEELIEHGYDTHDIMTLLSIAEKPFDAKNPVHQIFANMKPVIYEKSKYCSTLPFHYNLHHSMYEASQESRYAADWDIYFGIFHAFFQPTHLNKILQKYPTSKIKEYGGYLGLVFFKGDWREMRPSNVEFAPPDPLILESFKGTDKIDLYQLWTMVYRESVEIPLFLE